MLWGRVFPISFPPQLLQIHSVINRPIRNRSGLMFYRFNFLPREGAGRVSIVMPRDPKRNHSKHKGAFTFVYRAKVIFTARKRSLRRLCFHRCLSVHGGVSAPLHAGIHPRDQRQTPPRSDTPLLPAQCLLGYGQQTGGTHPTEMHSFF